jgi:pimeloyl-ACP methyl ester carboxylesterase
MQNASAIALKYVEQGRGPAVVFVHGIPADHRVWDEQREVVSEHYRYLAIDQRYFGASPWPDDGRNYSLATHVNDLAAFIEQLGSPGVHVVGASYGGAVALVLAAKRPELVRSLFLYEPASPALVSVVSDPAAKLVLAEERQEITTMQTDDPKQQVRIFAEWANNQPGQFNTWPLTALHQMMFENARTLALSRAAPPPTPVSCQELSAIRVPVCVLRGENTRKFYTIIAQQVHDCIPNSRLIVIPGGRHVGYIENPSAFNAALLAHLKGADAT